MSEEEKKLRPCQCGADVSCVLAGNNDTKTRSVEIKCKNCGIKVVNKVMRYTHEWLLDETIKRWNTRPIEDELQAEIDRLKEDLEQTKHLLNHANTKMGIIKNNSKCCRNSQKKCDGCLACCG